MAEIFEKENNITAAESMFERALKKYKYSKKVWSAYQLFQLRQKKVDAAKQLLSRSLQSLSKHKHVEVITRFACAEYDFGSVDRGRVLFEELLSSYPKRFDLWNVYVDKEIKAGCFAHARALFERMTASKQTTKNMKSVFKKFLAFEVQHGTITEQNAVKTRAREYVASLM
jgi:rRNA biogenesis protein RRP5